MISPGLSAALFLVACGFVTAVGVPLVAWAIGTLDVSGPAEGNAVSGATGHSVGRPPAGPETTALPAGLIADLDDAIGDARAAVEAAGRLLAGAR